MRSNDILVTTVLALLAIPAWAAPLPLSGGPETLINTTTLLDQLRPNTNLMLDGGYITTWRSIQSSGKGDIFLQRYDAAGAKKGGEVRVTNTPNIDEIDPAVGALTTGDYIIAYGVVQSVSPKFTMQAQRFNDAGIKQGNTLVLGGNDVNIQDIPWVIGLPGGTFSLVWEVDNRIKPNAGYGIHGYHFDSSLAVKGGEVRINTFSLGDQKAPALTLLADGTYAATWQTLNKDGSGNSIAFQRFDNQGGYIGTETDVNTTTVGDQLAPTLGALKDGGYIIAWASAGQDGSGWGIYSQRYDKAGAKVGGETLVNSLTLGDQQNPKAVGLSDGGYVIGWESADVSGKGIYFQRYDAAGAPVGGQTLVNATTANDQDSANLRQFGSGFIASWTSNLQDGSGKGVYARIYKTSQTPTPPPPTTSGQGSITVGYVPLKSVLPGQTTGAKTFFTAKTALTKPGTITLQFINPQGVTMKQFIDSFGPMAAGTSTPPTEHPHVIPLNAVKGPYSLKITVTSPEITMTSTTPGIYTVK